MNALHRTGFALIAAFALTPFHSLAQVESHYRAKRQQDRSDKRHHTTAKVIGGSTAGGAVVGGLLGGGKGALIGAGAGAGGGFLADRARKSHDVHKREEYGTVHTH